LIDIIAMFIGFFCVSFLIGEVIHLFSRGGSKAPPTEKDVLLLAAASDSQKTMVPWNPEMIKAWEELHGLIEAKPGRHVLEVRGGGYMTYLGTKTPGVIDETTIISSPFRVIPTNAWSRADAGVSQWPLLQAVLQKAREQQQH